MDIRCYEEVKQIIRSGDHAQALSKYADFITDAVDYVVKVEVLDEPSYILESIKSKKTILQKVETTFETLKKDSFEPEDSVQKLEELYAALKAYEEFIKCMEEKTLHSPHEDPL